MLRWTFGDGPTKGTTYEHRFGRDGSIGYRAVHDDPSFTKADQGAVVKVAPDVVVVSYLGHAGYTLTTVLNLREGTMVGFASNGQEWTRQRGRFEIVPQARGDGAGRSGARRAARASSPRAPPEPCPARSR